MVVSQAHRGWVSPSLHMGTHGTAQNCMDAMYTSSTGVQSIPGDSWLRALKGWSDWVALVILSSSSWKISVASGCGSKKARISMRWLFLSHLSSKWCSYCAWGSVLLWSRALEAFKNHLSFCKKIGNLTLAYLCRKYTTNSPCCSVRLS